RQFRGLVDQACSLGEGHDGAGANAGNVRFISPPKWRARQAAENFQGFRRCAMLKPSEKPLLALIEAGGVNDLPVIMPVATPNDALIEALKTVREAGYGVVKPRQRQYRRKGKHKDRAGPTYVCRFNDGEVVRMTIFTSLTKLDWARGEKLALAAYESRWRMRARRT